MPPWPCRAVAWRGVALHGMSPHIACPDGVVHHRPASAAASLSINRMHPQPAAISQQM